ncbi:MAG: hypothetical protein N2746_04805, partial [Deltaproteobacteria bacterium]|nr:hypothetical protein [Deltaproteobacteria bacterium]
MVDDQDRRIIKYNSLIKYHSIYILLLPTITYLVFTIIITYPLITDLTNHIPADLGDPLLNVWTLWWNLEKITNLDFTNYFDANVMFPYKKSLAFSEHLVGEAILGLPFYLVKKNPVFVYNILYILSFVVAGLGMFLLAYFITKSFPAAFIAGFIYAFAPHRINQAGHCLLYTSD